MTVKMNMELDPVRAQALDKLARVSNDYHLIGMRFTTGREPTLTESARLLKNLAVFEERTAARWWLSDVTKYCSVMGGHTAEVAGRLRHFHEVTTLAMDDGGLAVVRWWASQVRSSIAKDPSEENLGLQKHLGHLAHHLCTPLAAPKIRGPVVLDEDNLPLMGKLRCSIDRLREHYKPPVFKF